MTIEEACCGNCEFYMPNMRVCRRLPPVPLMIGVKQGIANLTQQEPLVMSYFPSMTAGGWCGEYKQLNAPEDNN